MLDEIMMKDDNDDDDDDDDGALLALLGANLVIANLVITITSLYDLTIQLFIFHMLMIDNDG